MPELPEVETITNDLKKKLLNKRIIAIEVRLPKIIKGDPGLFQKVLKGSEFLDIDRRGKLMIFTLKNKQFLLIHLKMTGQLVYREKGRTIAGGHSQKSMGLDLPNKYSHVIFTFADQSQLFFNDLRQFGYLRLVNQAELTQVLAKFGVEPLGPDFTFLKWQQLLQNKKRNIKAFLLDQSLIAGIGNIYADEILFASHVHPKRRTQTLSATEQKAIFENTKKILQKAVNQRGTTFNNYVDADGKKGNFKNFLQVYKKEGQPCAICGKSIQKTKIAGRGTRFCPKCQT